MHEKAKKHMPFYDSINNPNNFVISFKKNTRNDFGVFAKGYFLAASELANSLLSKNHFSDYEAYPVVFLYRHSLELYLKTVIYKADLISAFKHMDDIASHLYNKHKLPTLAEKATKILQKLFPHDDVLRDLLKEVAKV